MAYLSAQRRARIQRRILAIEAALDVAYATLLEAMGASEESYRFDSNEGSQQLKTTDTDKLNKSIQDLETALEHWYDALNCRGIVRLNLRRR